MKPSISNKYGNIACNRNNHLTISYLASSGI